jgi:protein-S-isoprenylcysteine O-methyltransferase Ste14
MKLWIKAALFLVLVPGTLLGVLPAWLIRSGPLASSSFGYWRLLGFPVLCFGALLMLWCVAAFVRQGEGTPAPIDSPRKLVVGAAYRWVRNPMYLAGGAILIGQAIIWEAPGLLLYLGAFWLVTHAFVVFYEEPKLTRQFGEQYERYMEPVPRWVPRPPKR